MITRAAASNAYTMKNAVLGHLFASLVFLLCLPDTSGGVPQAPSRPTIPDLIYNVADYGDCLKLTYRTFCSGT
jgi:hypothetical protein